MKKQIILENYELSPRTIRIKGENSYLLNIEHDSEYNRSKKDADKIGKKIVSSFNEFTQLKEENKKLKEALKLVDKWLYFSGVLHENQNDQEIIKFKKLFNTINK